MENGIVSIDTTGSSSGAKSVEEEIIAGHEALGIHYDKALALAMMEKGEVTLDDPDPATLLFQKKQRSTTILKVQAKQVKWVEYGECPANAGCRAPGADMFVWLDACPSMEELERAAERNEFELDLYYDFATRRCFLKRQNYPANTPVSPPSASEKFLPIWLAYTTESGQVHGATRLELQRFAERAIGQTTVLAVQGDQVTVQSLKDGTPITDAVGSGSTQQGVHLAHCLADEQLVPMLNSSNTQAEYKIDGQKVSVTVKPMKLNRSKEWFGWRDAPPCASGLKWTPKRQGVPDEEHIPLWVLQDLAHHELAVFETTADDCGANGAGFAVVTSGRSDSVALNSPEIRAFLDAAPNSKLVGHIHVDKRATIFPSRWDYGFLFERSKKNGQKTSLIYPKEGNYAYEFGLADTDRYEPEKWAKTCEDWRYTAEIVEAKIDPNTGKPEVTVTYDTNGKELDLEIAVFDDSAQKVLSLHRESVDGARTQAIPLSNWNRPPEQDYYLVWVNLVDPGVGCTRACTGKHYARDEGMHLHLGGGDTSPTMETESDVSQSGITFVTFAEDAKIPSWIKNNADWWADGLISDDEFVKGIEFLMANGTMVVSPVEVKSFGRTTEIPDWIKNNASWWAKGEISDSDFLKGIEFLIEEGIVRVSAMTSEEEQRLQSLANTLEISFNKSNSKLYAKFLASTTQEQQKVIEETPLAIACTDPVSGNQLFQHSLGHGLDGEYWRIISYMWNTTSPPSYVVSEASAGSVFPVLPFELSCEVGLYQGNWFSLSNAIDYEPDLYMAADIDVTVTFENGVMVLDTSTGFGTGGQVGSGTSRYIGYHIYVWNPLAPNLLVQHRYVSGEQDSVRIDRIGEEAIDIGAYEVAVYGQTDSGGTFYLGGKRVDGSCDVFEVSGFQGVAAAANGKYSRDLRFSSTNSSYELAGSDDLDMDWSSSNGTWEVYSREAREKDLGAFGSGTLAQCKLLEGQPKGGPSSCQNWVEWDGAQGYLRRASVKFHCEEGVVHGSDTLQEAVPVPGAIPDEYGWAGNPGPTIDLLVVYTQAAQDEAGGYDAMQQEVDRAVANTNRVFENSALSARVSLAGNQAFAVDYEEQGQSTLTAEYTAAQLEGLLGVAALREQYRADVTVVVFSSLNGFGPAGAARPARFLVPQFGMSRGDPAYSQDLVFAHELGHVLGCSHEDDNISAIFSYAKPIEFLWMNDTKRTIMWSEYSALIIPYFSNPRLLWFGEIPMGDPKTADCAGTIVQTAPVVASFDGQEFTQIVSTIVENVQSPFHEFASSLQEQASEWFLAPWLGTSHASPETDSGDTITIPEWVRNNAKWWAEGTIDDQSFIGGLSYLLEEGIIDVGLDAGEKVSFYLAEGEKLPEWLKKPALWWGTGQTTNAEFVANISQLIKLNVLEVRATGSSVGMEETSDNLPMVRICWSLDSCKSASHFYNLNWTLDGQPYSDGAYFYFSHSTVEHRSTPKQLNSNSPLVEIVGKTFTIDNESAVKVVSDREWLFLSAQNLRLESGGNHTLAFETQVPWQGKHGQVHMIARSDLPQPLPKEQTLQKLDKAAEDVANLLDFSVEKYKFRLAPISLRTSDFPRMFDTATKEIHQVYSLATVEKDVERSFGHEYTHQLFFEAFSRWAGVSCLDEGLANAVEGYLGYDTPLATEATLTDWDRVACNDSEQAEGNGAHRKGKCLFWHLETHGVLTPQFFAKLLHVDNPLVGYNTCRMDLADTGNRYLVYFYDAAPEESKERVSAALHAAGIPHDDLELARQSIEDEAETSNTSGSGNGHSPQPGITFVTLAEDAKIPSWIKTNAGWWAEGLIPAEDFIKGIEFLIANDVLVVPSVEVKSTGQTDQIPDWIKNNAGWWAKGQITDGEFLKGIQFLMEEGIVRVDSERVTTDSETEEIFNLPSIEYVPSPYLSWCDDESCVSDPPTVYACSTSGGCSLTHNFHLEWTINGRPFEGLWLYDRQWYSVNEYDDRAVFSPYDDKRFQIKDASSVLIRGDLSEISLSINYASVVSSGSSKLAYQGYGFKNKLGEVFVTYLPDFESKMPEKLEQHLHRFDDIAEKLSKAVGMKPVRYELHILPAEMMRDIFIAGEHHGSGRISLNRYLPIGGESYEDRTRYFAHEYGHVLFDRAIIKGNKDQDIRTHCLDEGVAESVAAYTEGNWGSSFAGSCTGIHVNRAKGECILWHAYDQGYLTEEFIHGLFNPETPLHFDSCTIDKNSSNAEIVGNGYLVYLSEAAGKDLTSVITAAGLSHAGSYLSAKAAYTEWLKKNGHCGLPWECGVPEELQGGESASISDSGFNPFGFGIAHCLADNPFVPKVHLSDAKSTVAFAANGQDISVDVVNLESQSQLPWSDDSWKTPECMTGLSVKWSPTEIPLWVIQSQFHEVAVFETTKENCKGFAVITSGQADSVSFASPEITAFVNRFPNARLVGHLHRHKFATIFPSRADYTFLVERSEKNGQTKSLIYPKEGNFAYEYGVVGSDAYDPSTWGKACSQWEQFTGDGASVFPLWVRTTASWWSKGQVSDQEFLDAISFLIRQKTVDLGVEIGQGDDKSLHASKKLQDWQKTTVGWWAQGVTSDAEFISWLKNQIETGVLEWRGKNSRGDPVGNGNSVGTDQSQFVFRFPNGIQLIYSASHYQSPLLEPIHINAPTSDRSELTALPDAPVYFSFSWDRSSSLTRWGLAGVPQDGTREDVTASMVPMGADSAYWQVDLDVDKEDSVSQGRYYQEEFYVFPDLSDPQVEQVYKNEAIGWMADDRRAQGYVVEAVELGDNAAVVFYRSSNTETPRLTLDVIDDYSSDRNADCARANGVPVAECRALASIFHATDGGNWHRNGGWLQTDTPCKWEGVTCQEERVVALRLPANQLTGDLPPAVGDLSKLQVLDLSDNKLFGTMPKELGELSELQHLNLKNNSMQGVIPEKVGTITSLRHLDLSYNSLNAPVPSLEQLVNLEVLNLGNSNILGEFPTQLPKSELLRVLDLSNNFSTGEFPESLTQYRNLDKLDLSYNELTGSIPADLGELTTLSVLNLSGNYLTESIPSTLGNLIELVELNLSWNDLSGEIPPDLGKLINLRELRLDNNDLSGEIPATLKPLIEDPAVYVDISGNENIVTDYLYVCFDSTDCRNNAPYSFEFKWLVDGKPYTEVVWTWWGVFSGTEEVQPVSVEMDSAGSELVIAAAGLVVATVKGGFLLIRSDRANLSWTDFSKKEENFNQLVAKQAIEYSTYKAAGRYGPVEMIAQTNGPVAYSVESTMDAVVSSIDRTSEALVTLFGIDELENNVRILPEAFTNPLVGGEHQRVWGGKSLITLYADIAPESPEQATLSVFARLRKMFSTFAHEKAHQLVSAAFPGWNAGKGNVQCFTEGVAYLVEWELGLAKPDLEDTDWLTGACNDSTEPYGSEYHNKGSCLMWHVKDKGFTSNGFYSRLLVEDNPLFRHDSCALDDPMIGNRLLVYLSAAADKEVSDALDAAGVPHDDLETAKQKVGVAPTVPSEGIGGGAGAPTQIAFAKEADIPSWIKETAGWWAQGLISAEDFVKGIEFLIANDILLVPQTEVKTAGQTTEIPDWIKNNAGWWATGQISDGDFLKGVQFLIKEGLVRVGSEQVDTTSATPIVFADGLVASWDFDEENFETKYKTTLQGKRSDSRDGKALAGSIEITTEPLGRFAYRDKFSVSAWIWPNEKRIDESAVIGNMIWTKSLPTSKQVIEQKGWSFSLTSSGKLRFAVAQHSGRFLVFETTASVANEAWTRVGAQWNSSSGEQEVTFYIGGVAAQGYVKKRSLASTQYEGLEGVIRPEFLHEGSLFLGAATYNSERIHSFSGAIDDVELYRGKLPPEAVSISGVGDDTPNDAGIFSHLSGVPPPGDFLFLVGGFAFGAEMELPEEGSDVPTWIKFIAESWVNGAVGDEEFKDAIAFLIQNDVIHIGEVESPSTASQEEIPAWIKTNAAWWVEGSIDDATFVTGIEFLVKEGILRVNLSEDVVDISENSKDYVFFSDFEMDQGCDEKCQTWGLAVSDQVDEPDDDIFVAVQGEPGEGKLVYQHPAQPEWGAVYHAFHQDLTPFASLSFQIEALRTDNPRSKSAGCVALGFLEKDGDRWQSGKFAIHREERTIEIPLRVTEFSYEGVDEGVDIHPTTGRRFNWDAIQEVSFAFIPNVKSGETDNVQYAIDTLTGRATTSKKVATPDCDVVAPAVPDPGAVVVAGTRNPYRIPLVKNLLSQTSYRDIPVNDLSKETMHWTTDLPLWAPGHGEHSRFIRIHESFAGTRERPEALIAEIVRQTTHHAFHKQGFFTYALICHNARQFTCPELYARQSRIPLSERQWRDFHYNLWMDAAAEAMFHSMIVLLEIQELTEGEYGQFELDKLLLFGGGSPAVAQAAVEAYWDDKDNESLKQQALLAVKELVQYRMEPVDSGTLAGEFNEQLLNVWGFGTEMTVRAADVDDRVEEHSTYMQIRDIHGHYDLPISRGSNEYDPRDRDYDWYQAHPPDEGKLRVQYDSFSTKLNKEGKFESCGTERIIGTPVPCAGVEVAATDVETTVDSNLEHCVADEPIEPTLVATKDGMRAEFAIDGEQVSVAVVDLRSESDESKAPWNEETDWVKASEQPKCLAGLDVKWTRKKIPLWFLQRLSHNEVAVFETTVQDCDADGQGFAMVTSGESGSVTLDSGPIQQFLKAVPHANLVGHVHVQTNATIFPSRSDYTFLVERNEKNGQTKSLIYPKEGNYAYEFGLVGTDAYDPVTWGKACKQWEQFTAEGASVFPLWVRTTASWWSKGQVSEQEFLDAISFLIRQKTVDLGVEIGQGDDKSLYAPKELQDWQKTTVGWWAQGVTSDAEFISWLKNQIEAGVLEWRAKEHSQTNQLDETGFENGEVPAWWDKARAPSWTDGNKNTLLDVLILYTPSVKSAAGSKEQVAKKILDELDQTNEVFRNSEVGVRIRPVHMGVVAFVESSDVGDDVEKFLLAAQKDSDTDGFRTVRTSIADYQPDVVVVVGRYHLLRNHAGAAYRPNWDFSLDLTGFMGLDWDSIDTDVYYPFAHEIGHVLGCSHGDEPSEESLFPYSRGHEAPGAFHTVMSAKTDILLVPAIPHFSNPRVKYQGIPTGVERRLEGEADCAFTMEQTAPILARNRGPQQHPSLFVTPPYMEKIRFSGPQGGPFTNEKGEEKAIVSIANDGEGAPLLWRVRLNEDEITLRYNPNFLAPIAVSRSSGITAWQDSTEIEVFFDDSVNRLKPGEYIGTLNFEGFGVSIGTSRSVELRVLEKSEYDAQGGGYDPQDPCPSIDDLSQLKVECFGGFQAEIEEKMWTASPRWEARALIWTVDGEDRGLAYTNRPDPNAAGIGAEPHWVRREFAESLERFRYIVFEALALGRVGEGGLVQLVLEEKNNGGFWISPEFPIQHFEAGDNRNAHTITVELAEGTPFGLTSTGITTKQKLDLDNLQAISFHFRNPQYQGPKGWIQITDYAIDNVRLIGQTQSPQGQTPTGGNASSDNGNLNHCLGDTPFEPTEHLSDTKSTVEFSVNGQDISVEVVNLESQSQIPWSEDNWKTPKCMEGLNVHWSPTKIPLWVIQSQFHEVAVFETTKENCQGFAVVTSGQADSVSFDSPEITAFLDRFPKARLVGHLHRHDFATIFPSRADYTFLVERSEKNGQTKSLIYPKEGSYAYEYGLVGTDAYDPATWGKACNQWEQFTGDGASVFPLWVRTTASWWSEGQVSDQEFLDAVSFLIREKTVDLGVEIGQGDDKSFYAPKELQDWQKTTVGWWAQGVTSDAEFISWLKNQIEAGVLEWRSAGGESATTNVDETLKNPLEESLTQETGSPQIMGDIPQWFVDTTTWWSEDRTSDAEFLHAVQTLIDQGGVVFPTATVDSDADKQLSVPEWMKTTASWWINEQIDTITFFAAIQHLVEHGIVQVPAAEGVPIDAINGREEDTSHAAVMKVDSSNDAVCSGTLIKVDKAVGMAWILTAAHCTDSLPNAIVQGVDASNPRAVRYPVLDWQVHPTKDLALVRITKLGATLPEPIALPSNTSQGDGLQVGDVIELLGYGYGNNNELSKRHKITKYISALDDTSIVHHREKTGTCPGDSGGPVLVGSPGPEKIVGVHRSGNWGNTIVIGGCISGGTGMSERVFPALSWIREGIANYQMQPPQIQTLSTQVIRGDLLTAYVAFDTSMATPFQPVRVAIALVDANGHFVRVHASEIIASGPGASLNTQIEVPFDTAVGDYSLKAYLFPAGHDAEEGYPSRLAEADPVEIQVDPDFTIDLDDTQLVLGDMHEIPITLYSRRKDDFRIGYGLRERGATDTVSVFVRGMSEVLTHEFPPGYISGERNEFAVTFRLRVPEELLVGDKYEVFAFVHPASITDPGEAYGKRLRDVLPVALPVRVVKSNPDVIVESFDKDIEGWFVVENSKAQLDFDESTGHPSGSLRIVSDGRVAIAKDFLLSSKLSNSPALSIRVDVRATGQRSSIETETAEPYDDVFEPDDGVLVRLEDVETGEVFDYREDDYLSGHGDFFYPRQITLFPPQTANLVRVRLLFSLERADTIHIDNFSIRGIDCECNVGYHRCNGESISELCSEVQWKTGCFAWTVAKRCEASETCEAGLCVEGLSTADARNGSDCGRRY